MVTATTLSKNQSTALFLLIIGLFFIQPFGALVLLLLTCYATFGKSKQDWNRNIFIFISLSILLLAIINSSKANDNDLYYYIRWFKQSGNTDLFTYISNQPKKSESAYAVYVWLANNVISNSEAVFKFITTAIQYIFLSLATLRLCNKITTNKAVIMTALILTCFNPYVFSLSIQLVRQSLAVSIFIYVMVERCIYHRNHWFLIVLCPMIHTMTLLLVILLFIPVLNKPIKKNITAYSIILLIISSIRVISGYLLSLSAFSDPTASYALRRASADKVFDLGKATPSAILLTIIIFATSFYCSHIQTKKAVGPIANSMRHMYNIPAIIAIFVLLNVNLSEIFGRFLMLLYPFIPLIFASLFKDSKINRLLFLCGSILIIIAFIYLAGHSVWSYQYLSDILNSGMLYLI